MSRIPNFNDDPMASLVWAWNLGYDFGRREALEGCTCVRPNPPRDRVVLSLDDYRAGAR